MVAAPPGGRFVQQRPAGTEVAGTGRGRGKRPSRRAAEAVAAAGTHPSVSSASCR